MSEANKPLPAHKRPVDPTPVHTQDLPDLPIATYNIPADAWIEAPAALLESGADIGEPTIMYKRRIGPWLLWRAGPARKADARYVALHHADLTRIHTFRIYPDGSGEGVGPKGHRSPTISDVERGAQRDGVATLLTEPDSPGPSIVRETPRTYSVST